MPTSFIRSLGRTALFYENMQLNRILKVDDAITLNCKVFGFARPLWTPCHNLEMATDLLRRV
jgi:hypothetical protein